MEDETEFIDITTKRNRGVTCVNKQDDVCNKYLDLNKMNNTITTSCLGKDLCTISNFETFIKKPDLATMYEYNYKRCSDDDAILYVQVFCLQSEEELN